MGNPPEVSAPPLFLMMAAVHAIDVAVRADFQERQGDALKAGQAHAASPAPLKPLAALPGPCALFLHW